MAQYQDALDDQYLTHPSTSSGLQSVRDDYPQMTESISEFYSHIRSGQETSQVLQWQAELEDVFRQFYPRSRLYLIGSYAYGLQMEESTIDFMLLKSEDDSLFYERFESRDHLHKLKKFLTEDLQRFNAEVVDKPVPMLQIQDNNNGYEGNILLHYMPSIQNTFLMRCYAEVDPRIKPLVFIIKKWATKEQIINVKGKLTGFGLLQLIFHYLQTGCKPAVVPSLQEKFSGTFRLGKVNEMFEKVESGFIPEEIQTYKSPNNRKVGELLVGFFRFYANYGWGNYGQAISIRNSRGLTNKPKFDDTWSKPFLRIEDPFDLKNVGAGCTQHGGFAAIKLAFKEAHQALNHNPSVDSLFA